MRSQTKITVYDTDPDLYDILARVFSEEISGDGAHAWVNFNTTAGVEITLFKRTPVDAGASSDYVGDIAPDDLPAAI